MEQLTALDAAFLELEDEHVALHIGSTAVFEGPAPTNAEIINRYKHFVAVHPRYRQVVSRVRFDLRRPEWRPAEVELDFHVRRTALAAPGDQTRLEQLIGRIMSTPLDPGRPLWEAWIVEGLAEDRWALVFKLHHSIVDGVGGMQMFSDLLDPGDGVPIRNGKVPAEPPDWSPARLLGREVRRFIEVGRTTVALPGSLTRFVMGVPAGLHALRFAPPSSLNGALGRSRTYRTLSVDRAQIDAVRACFGGTVNDVVLAMVTGGFHALLNTRGEPLVQGEVRCMVPVDVRTPAELDAGSNKVSFVLVDLPVELNDTREAFLALRNRVRGAKGSSAKQAVQTGFALADRVPSPVASAFIAAVRQVPQRIVTTVCTNVPGPRTELSLLGRRLVSLYPYVPIGDRVRIAVAVTSYQGQLHFGVTGDRNSVRDADVFMKAMEAGLNELVSCS
jgi:WS/DGAT/MGAT family acyltransferase